jgi:predicted enzyme related to lactoylglutathione lyase
MEEQKQWRHGQVVWRELLCPDAAKAKAFYGELCGWSFSDMPMGPGMTYTVAKRGDKQVAGFMPASPNMGPPAWLSYVSVKDIDATVAAAKSHGGKVPMDPMSAPGVGRFCVVNDPTGGYLGLLQGESAGDAPGMPKPGEFCWESLNTSDVEKAKAFYQAVLGWSIGTGMGNDMPIFKAGEAMVADVAPLPAPGMPTHWLAHLVVERLEAGRDRAVKLGGSVLMPLVEIPKVGRIAVVRDSLGAVVSLFEPGRPAT